MPHVLMVTANHFWLADRGSHRRIYSLVTGLHDAGCHIEVAILGELTDNAAEAASAVCPILQLGANRPPVPPGMRLDAFYSEQVGRSFERLVRSRRPDVIIVEYIHLAFLIDYIPPELREQTTLVLDTHDVMHLRCSSFRTRNEQHWVDITRDEEADAVSRFDVIIAIQDNEAIELASMAPSSRVIIAPYAIEPRNIPRVGPQSSRAFGLIGVNGPHNIDALNMLLEDIWPRLHEQSANSRLVIAGPVTQSCPAAVPGVHSLGLVDTPDDFHRQIDVLINPVRIGGGLKIKNVEALSAGRPVITTPIGAQGFTHDSGRGLMVARTAEEFVHHATILTSDHRILDDAKLDAQRIVHEQFSPTHAYQELIETLGSHVDYREAGGAA